MPLHRFILFSGLLLSLLAGGRAAAGPGPLPSRLLVGYWHNWMSSPVHFRLSDVPPDWDVVDVAFAVPTQWGGATMGFTPDAGIYPSPQDFRADVNLLEQRGAAVLISIGGATAPVQLDTEADVLDFVSSMHGIITDYGFRGLDIDLEGQSLFLEVGDTDFRNPTSPRIVNLIAAVRQLLALLPDDFILTAAPETALVQGGFAGYGGVYGAYLPVIHALRDELTFIHVQHYNSGTMFGRDGGIYTPGTADFHVAMAEMLLAGFTVHGGAFFPPLRADQVLIGLPAAPGAAGSGYTAPPVVTQALDYLVKGISFGGEYQLAVSQGYPEFRGLMAWSINWDVGTGAEFAAACRPYLDSLGGQAAGLPPRGRAALHQNHPNPFNPVTRITYELDRPGPVLLEVFDLAGRRVATLVDGRREAGAHEAAFRAEGLASGHYLCRLRTAAGSWTRNMTLVK